MSERSTQAAPPQDVVASSSDEVVVPPVHDITATTVSGARVRRSTQVFVIEEPKADDPDAFEPPTGAGQKLQDIPGVCDTIAALSKKDVETIKALYSVMYGRRFQLKNVKVIKEHILAFSGIPLSENNTLARDALTVKIAKWHRSFLQVIMDVVGVDRSKKSFDDVNKSFDKDTLIERLVDWLYNPQPTTKNLKQAAALERAEKQKLKKAATKQKATAKRTSSAKHAPATKKQKTTKKTIVKEHEENDDDEEDDDDEETESEDDNSDYDDKKKKKKVTKVTKAKKKPAAKKTKKAPVAETSSEDDDDAPKEPKASVAPSTDAVATSSSSLAADVQAKVKQIIAAGNAEELTVKSIVRQVSEELGRDLSSEKSAIKEFIRAGQ